MTTNENRLIACPDCDLLQREVSLHPGCAARCSRCGATLYRNASDSLNRTFSLSVAATIVYFIANVYPILGIESWGGRKFVSLFEAVTSLWDQGMHAVASVVFLTTIVIPGIELSLLLYLFVGLRLHRAPSGVVPALRILQRIRPWSMVEVFMLAVLVSIAKLRYNFSVMPGVALWSFGALTVLLAASATCFSGRDLWAELERLRSGEQAP